MYKDERDILEVLKAELVFLEEGGYGRSPGESWRQPLIFEDSPSCANYNSTEHSVPCSECVLFQLVPPQFRDKQIPCRFIPFNAEGDTLVSLGRHSDQLEIEEIFGNWLRKNIAAIEKERQASGTEKSPAPATGGNQPVGERLSHKLHPKCANPACAASFRWLAGGKFFRFRPESAVAAAGGQETGPAALAIAGVEHFWLCERCSQIFTLAFDAGQGVVLKVLFPELEADEATKQLLSR